MSSEITLTAQEMERKPVRIILWTGGDAPSREAKLDVKPTGGPVNMAYAAYWTPGYCGCPDCHPIVGVGSIAAEAEADYWERWEER